MNPTLKRIQVLARIGMILSRIAFICCIIGAVGCAVGIACFALAGDTVFTLGGVSVHSLIENTASLSEPALYAAMATGLLFCAAEAVLSRFAVIYFRNELADGTPFTLRGAKELMRLGVLTIAIPLGTAIVCSIGIAVADNFYPGLEKLSAGEYSSAGLGIMMLVLSLFCRYGAEVTGEKPAEAGQECADPAAVL